MNKVYIPEKQKVASFDVDAQNTFTPVCPEELPVNDGNSIVAELNAQASFAGLRIGSKDAHSPNAIWVADKNNPQFSPIDNQANVDIRWNLHAVPGTKGFDLIDGLPDVTEYDYFVWKGIETNMHPYGACYHDLGNKMSTGVIEYLKVNKIETIIVGGLATDFCVKTTAIQLAEAGFRVIVNMSACRGISEDTINKAIKEMEENSITIITSTKELIRG